MPDRWRMKRRLRIWPQGVAVFAFCAVVAAGWFAGTRGAEGPPEKPYPHGEWTDDCSGCHQAEKWLPAHVPKEFAHAKNFPLRGAHRTAACQACHKSLEFLKVPRACVECHQDVHRGEFGTDCGRCHTTVTFIDRLTAVRAHRTSRFALTGAHVTSDCESCHRIVAQGKLMYLGTPTDCAACHAASGYPAAPQRPQSHVEASFSLDCAACHSTVSFKSARFNHAGTGFPLTGAHTTLDCVACHGDPFNPNLDPTCYSCHQTDYQNTTDPNHVAAGFSTDCTQCHTTTTFDGARYTQHDSLYFPIYSGTHNGRWDNCSDCHTNSNNYSQFTCLTCHTQSETNPEHSDVDDYVYDSNACYSCHPTGQAEDR